MNQIRTLVEIQDEINDVAHRWHELWCRCGNGEAVLEDIRKQQNRLDRLYAEKRWVKAGALTAGKEAAEMERRIRMSLDKYRYSTAYDMLTIAMQLEGA